jgi:hypothetical protein
MEPSMVRGAWVFEKVDPGTLSRAVETHAAVDRLWFPDGKPEFAAYDAAERALFREAGFREWQGREYPCPRQHEDGRPVEAGTVLTIATPRHARGVLKCYYLLGPYAVTIEGLRVRWSSSTLHPQWGWAETGERQEFCEASCGPTPVCAVCGDEKWRSHREITLDGVDVVLCFECYGIYFDLETLVSLEVGELRTASIAKSMRANLRPREPQLLELWEKLRRIVNARRVGDGGAGSAPAMSALPPAAS